MNDFAGPLVYLLMESHSACLPKSDGGGVLVFLAWATWSMTVV